MVVVYSLTTTDIKVQSEGPVAGIMLILTSFFTSFCFQTAAISPATVTSGRAPSQQELLPLLLKLKKRCMPRSIKLLQITCAATQLPLQIWQEHRSKRMICSDRLVEIAQQLDLFVSVGLHDASKPAERRSSSASR
ncbi:TPA: hypothetical protein ACH3X2_007566 [Trebouxia sp. C0005]